MSHYEILVEEPSMEAFLGLVLPKLLDETSTFLTHVFRGKPDLLKRLGDRLRGYKKWLPENYRIIILMDRDDDDCYALKNRIEEQIEISGLKSKRENPRKWEAASRIVIEELEAWYFGEWEGVRTSYKGIPDVTKKQKYRFCDDIRGGTCEAFERVLQGRSFYKEGLPKVEAALTIGRNFEPARCQSPSFLCFKALF